MSQSKSASPKRVLVTGAGTGIGKAIALAFARAGCDVAAHYAHDEKGAAEVVDVAKALGRNAKAFRQDLSMVDNAKALGREALDFLGGIDVLVNNAGVTTNLPFEEVAPEQFDFLFHVNVRAMFFLTQYVVPTMIEQGHGAVVNLSSIHAFEGRQEHSVYASTKGAIVSFTRQLAIELAPSGIRVNAIAPGATPVENHYKVEPDLDVEELGRKIPIGFAGDPSDIANVAVFLASDEARYIVGQTIVVDGGTTSWMSFDEGFRVRSSVRFGRGYVPGL